VIYIDDGKRPSFEHPIMGLDGREPIYSLLTPLVAAELSIGVEKIPLLGGGWRNLALNRPAGRFLRKRALGFYRVCRDAFRSRTSLSGQKTGKAPSLTGIVSGSAHDLAQIEEYLEKSGKFSLIDDAPFWRPLSRRLVLGRGERAKQHHSMRLESLELSWGRMRVEPNIRRFFRQEGVSWDGLVDQWLEHFFTRGIQQIYQYHNIGTRVADKYQPKFFLTVRKGDHAHAAFSSAFQKAGIPVVYTQEGGGYGYATNPLDYHVDLCRSDYFLSYGPAVANHLRKTKMTPRQTAVPIPVGSARLSAIRPKVVGTNLPTKQVANRPHETTIMYVPTRLHHSIVFNYTPEDTSYFLMQKRILETLAEFPSTRVILQLGAGKVSSTGPLKDLARDVLPDSSIVEESFISVVGLADALIIDWPSTVLLEALSTRIPVIAYMDSVVARVEPRALELLKSRAFVSSTFSGFLSDIRRFAANASECAAEMDLDNTDFIEQYAFPIKGPDVASRLVEFFETLQPVKAGA